MKIRWPKFSKDARYISVIAVCLVCAYLVWFAPTPKDKIINYGQGVYLFDTHNFGNALSTFLSHNPGVEVTTVSQGNVGWKYGYFVIVHKKSQTN
jgi:hypothetical protein